MKIVYSLGSIGNSGGIERVISTKANYFTELPGCDVHIIVAGKKTQSLFYQFSDKIHFHYLNLSFPKLSIYHFLFSTKQDKIYKKKLEQLLSEIKPDITISIFGRDASFLYKLKDGSKKVLEFHFTKNYLIHLGNSLENDKYKHLRKYWLLFLTKREEQLAKKYNHIVLLTERDKKLWGNRDKFAVIPNPLSFEIEKKSTLDSKIIVSMGRLVYPKGFQYLIRAFSLIEKQFPDWKVKIYGEGHDREKLQNEINNLSLQDRIFLEQPDDKVEEIMCETASIFVLPSLYDGFGLVLTEAMECGVPCIAFDCECGPGEIISDKEDGFLVETKNSKQLAEKMSLLMSNSSLRKKMGEKAKENVKKFSMNVIADKWSNYFASLLK